MCNFSQQSNAMVHNFSCKMILAWKLPWSRAGVKLELKVEWSWVQLEQSLQQSLELEWRLELYFGQPVPGVYGAWGPLPGAPGHPPVSLSLSYSWPSSDHSMNYVPNCAESYCASRIVQLPLCMVTNATFNITHWKSSHAIGKCSPCNMRDEIWNLAPCKTEHARCIMQM